MGKEKKLNNVFKVFNNKGNKRDKKSVRPPIKCGYDTILPETIKDAYINGNYGSQADRSPTEEEEDEENSPPMVQFKNLAADPDLAGMKFKNMRELKKFKSKNKYDDDENDDQSESSFSDILKYVRKDEKKTGKIKKKRPRNSLLLQVG